MNFLSINCRISRDTEIPPFSWNSKQNEPTVSKDCPAKPRSQTKIFFMKSRIRRMTENSSIKLGLSRISSHLKVQPVDSCWWSLLSSSNINIKYARASWKVQPVKLTIFPLLGVTFGIYYGCIYEFMRNQNTIKASMINGSSFDVIHGVSMFVYGSVAHQVDLEDSSSRAISSSSNSSSISLWRSFTFLKENSKNVSN